METKHARNSRKSLVQWTSEEKKQFFALWPMYHNNFRQYMERIDRSYNQIKCFFHNWLNRQPEEVKQKFLGQCASTQRQIHEREESSHEEVSCDSVVTQEDEFEHLSMVDVLFSIYQLD